MKNFAVLKGQFWSFDVIFAMIVFSVVIVILAFTWNNVSTQLASSYGNTAEIMQAEAVTLAKSVMSPGYPADWMSNVNTTNPSTWTNVSIGIAAGHGSTIISSAKLYTFIAMANANYQDTKTALGVGYDYYIRITNSNLNISIGENPNTNGARDVYVYTEPASLNGEAVVVSVEVWSAQNIAV
jgi:hypothetical protein